MIRWYVVLLLLCLSSFDRPAEVDEAADLVESDAVRVDNSPLVVDDAEQSRRDLLAAMALAPSQSFPAGVPWAPMHEIGTKGLYQVDFLIHYHPTIFLEMCLERYKREVRGYSARFIKRERIAGKLEPLEKLEVHCREEPFSVYMNWLEGARLAQKVLYVKGENDGKLLARGAGALGFLPILKRDVDSDDAKKTGRYTIDHFGVFLGMQRTVTAMNRAYERGTLHVRYEGVWKVPELGGRACYKFMRTPYQPVEEEGVNELTLYIDQENWIQVGSVLKDVDGKLIAEYYFRDLKINPEFKAEQFTRAAL